MTPAALTVWEQIVRAFPPVLPPQPVTTCTCEECRDVRAQFGHLRWDQVLPPTMEPGFGWLPLLTDEAFPALLPAFLFHALRDLQKGNKVLEWTLYSLCPDSGEDADRAAHMTDAQRAAVRAFLILTLTTPDLPLGECEAIRRALDEIWVQGNPVRFNGV